MFGKFIDREGVFSLLEEEWEKEKGRLIVLYGRRRIGKTRLLMEFAKGKKRNGIFYIAEESSALIVLSGSLLGLMSEKVLRKRGFLIYTINDFGKHGRIGWK